MLEQPKISYRKSSMLALFLGILIGFAIVQGIGLVHDRNRLNEVKNQMFKIQVVRFDKFNDSLYFETLTFKGNSILSRTIDSAHYMGIKL